MATQKTGWDQDFTRFRQLLARLLRDCAESREPVAEMLELLERMEARLRSGSADGSAGVSMVGSSRPRYQRKKTKSYRVERHHNAWFLAEYREGGKQPFLCPQEVYDALAAELAAMSEPAHYTTLIEAVTRRMGRPPSDYLIRICIRFWMHGDPPLIERIRARYRPIRPSKFLQESKRAWRQLEKAHEN